MENLKMYERLNKYLEGEEVDSYPFEIFSLPEALAWNMGYATSDLSKADIFDEVAAKAYEEYDLDVAGIGLGQPSIAEVLGSQVIYPENGSPFIQEHFLKDYEQLKALPERIGDVSDSFHKKIEYGKDLLRRNPNFHLQTGLTAPMTTAGGMRRPELLLRDMRKNSEAMRELLEISLSYALEWVELFTEEFGPTRVHVSDAMSSLDLLAPKQFFEFSSPYFTRMIEGVYKITSIKPRVHICGRTAGIWEYLADLPISIFSVDNIEDLGEMREVMGDRVAIMGNVPPVDVMKLGRVEEVKEAVDTCIEKGSSAAAGFILATGCDIPHTVPIENLEAFVEAVKVHGSVRIG